VKGQIILLLITFKPIARGKLTSLYTFLDIGDFELLYKQKFMPQSHQSSYSCNTIACGSKY